MKSNSHKFEDLGWCVYDMFSFWNSDLKHEDCSYRLLSSFQIQFYSHIYKVKAKYRPKDSHILTDYQIFLTDEKLYQKKIRIEKCIQFLEVIFLNRKIVLKCEAMYRISKTFNRNVFKTIAKLVCIRAFKNSIFFMFLLRSPTFIAKCFQSRFLWSSLLWKIYKLNLVLMIYVLFHDLEFWRIIFYPCLRPL